MSPTNRVANGPIAHRAATATATRFVAPCTAHCALSFTHLVAARVAMTMVVAVSVVASGGVAGAVAAVVGGGDGAGRGHGASPAAWLARPSSQPRKSKTGVFEQAGRLCASHNVNRSRLSELPLLAIPAAGDRSYPIVSLDTVHGLFYINPAVFCTWYCSYSIQQRADH